MLFWLDFQFLLLWLLFSTALCPKIYVCINPNIGLKFSLGKLKDWWKPETSENFKEKSQCIIWQYGNYTKLGLQINGINTQGENIADNGGIKEAYLGYG